MVPKVSHTIRPNSMHSLSFSMSVLSPVAHVYIGKANLAQAETDAKQSAAKLAVTCRVKLLRAPVSTRACFPETSSPAGVNSGHAWHATGVSVGRRGHVT